jgi:exodeoxyribonuclease VII small subunit
MNSEKSESKSYLTNYQKLKQIAETMRESDEPDIDQLVAMINEANKAYKQCQARIEAVEKAILAEKK